MSEAVEGEIEPSSAGRGGETPGNGPSINGSTISTIEHEVEVLPISGEPQLSFVLICPLPLQGLQR